MKQPAFGTDRVRAYSHLHLITEFRISIHQQGNPSKRLHAYTFTARSLGSPFFRQRGKSHPTPRGARIPPSVEAGQSRGVGSCESVGRGRDRGRARRCVCRGPAPRSAAAKKKWRGDRRSPHHSHLIQEIESRSLLRFDYFRRRQAKTSRPTAALRSSTSVPGSGAVPAGPAVTKPATWPPYWSPRKPRSERLTLPS